MTRKTSKTLTPKRRFPEFRDAPGWEVRDGDELFEQIIERGNGIDLPILAITQEHGAIPRNLIDYHVTVSDKSVENYKVVRRGDYIISLRSFQGGIEYSLYDGLCSPAYVILRKNEEVPDQFFKEFFKSERFITQLTKNLEGLRDGKMISYKQFSEQSLPYPSIAEQRKIADCLGSLDDWIAAARRKLAALRDHKRGLMQQLFPQPNQSQPQQRFPEFRDAPAWKPVRLSNLGKLVAGLTYRPDDVQENGLLVLRSSNVQHGVISLEDCVYVDPEVKRVNLSMPNDILICVRNGSKSLIGKNALIPPGLPTCTHGAFMTVFRSKSPTFVFYLLQTATYQRQVDADLGATINSINGKQLLRYRFSVPKEPEQKLIAACLTALDTKITAQAAQLDTLHQHKRGLMQQLFPSSEGS